MASRWRARPPVAWTASTLHVVQMLCSSTLWRSAGGLGSPQRCRFMMFYSTGSCWWAWTLACQLFSLVRREGVWKFILPWRTRSFLSFLSCAVAALQKSADSLGHVEETSTGFMPSFYGRTCLDRERRATAYPQRSRTFFHNRNFFDGMFPWHIRNRRGNSITLHLAQVALVAANAAPFVPPRKKNIYK